MTISQLECFVEAARCGNFSAAAANLFRTQQNVSRQIRLLEAELGVPLFRRKSHGVELTEDGKLFYEEEQELLKRHRTVVDVIKDRSIPGAKRLHIGIGGFGRVEQHGIADLITEFSIAYSDLDVEYELLSPAALLFRLEDGTCDIGIVYETELEKAPDIRIRIMDRKPGMPGIILSDRHPQAKKKQLDIKALENEVWGVLSKEASLDHSKRVEAFLRREYGAGSYVIKPFSSHNNLQIALANQKCVTLAFQDLLRGMEDRLCFYPVETEDRQGNICLAWKKDRIETKVKNLADFFNLKYF